MRATTASGELKKRKKAEATVWYGRLWHETGLIEPAPVPMPPLPDTVDDVVRDVARDFELLLGLRWLTHPGEPMPFARKLAGPWSGRSPKQAYRAIGVLEKHGTIRALDTIVNTGKIGITPLYGPGIVARRESTR